MTCFKHGAVEESTLVLTGSVRLGAREPLQPPPQAAVECVVSVHPIGTPPGTPHRPRHSHLRGRVRPHAPLGGQIVRRIAVVVSTEAAGETLQRARHLHLHVAKAVPEHAYPWGGVQGCNNGGEKGRRRRRRRRSKSHLDGIVMSTDLLYLSKLL